MLIPWSAFWDRNFFIESSPVVREWLTSNYTRGAITGLGLVNVWTALAELADLFGGRGQPPELPTGAGAAGKDNGHT